MAFADADPQTPPPDGASPDEAVESDPSESHPERDRGAHGHARPIGNRDGANPPSPPPQRGGATANSIGDDGEIVPTRVAAGIVLFRRQPRDATAGSADDADRNRDGIGDGAPRFTYCLLQNAKHYSWGFPKGHLEEGETIEECAYREVEEETGLDRAAITLLDDFRDVTEYFVRRQRTRKGKVREAHRKLVHVFAGEVTGEARLHISKEHRDGQWLPIVNVLRIVQFENLRRLFRTVATRIGDPDLP